METEIFELYSPTRERTQNKQKAIQVDDERLVGQGKL